MTADFVVSIIEVAVIYNVVNDSAEDTVRFPLEFILVPCVGEPVPDGLELTFHVTALSGLFVPVTCALN